MSGISPRGEQSTQQESTILTALWNLSISPTGQFIQKTGDMTFSNVSPSGLSATSIGNGSVTSVMYQYLTGVTSSIQTQLDSKINSVGGIINPASITGVTTNSNAPAGAVGEIISSTIATANKVALTTATTANVTSISLTAGDWDVSGVVDYSTGGATAIAIMQQGISATSATLGAQDTFSSINLGATVTTDPVNMISPTRISIASTTTIYLVANATFTVSTLSAYGTIRARRMR